jgi:hypothetical protein
VFWQKLADQCRELKSRAADFLLLMQVGTFMQVMNEGVRAAAG